MIGAVVFDQDGVIGPEVLRAARLVLRSPAQLTVEAVAGLPAG